MTQDSVTRSVTVPLSPDAAFALFTAGFNTWWPKEHCFCGEAALERVFIDLDTRQWGEVTRDGRSLPWGAVLAVSRPNHLVLGWQMDARVSPWVPDPDPERASLVEIRITPAPDGATVTLTHSSFDRHGDGAGVMASVMIGLDRWQDWLTDFATAACDLT